MNEIILHRDDLEKILQIVDKMNPAEGDSPAAGMVTITADNSSGIGSIISMKCRVELDGELGWFVKEIVDESSW